jgi:hypothetical protein
MDSDTSENDNRSPDEAKENSISSRMEFPQDNKLDRECIWTCLEPTGVSGIERRELWTLRGMIGAVGYFDGEKQNTIGSGVMVAPGLFLTATHVFDGLVHQPFLFSFVDNTTMRIWMVEDFHAQQFKMELVPFQSGKPKFSDVCVASCSPFSNFSDSQPFCFPCIEVCIPKIGERLWTVGYREQSNDGAPLVDCFTSSGLVTEIYMNGRGAFLKGPCIEIAMAAVGGMSGGPVFNCKGKLVGVISTSFDGEEGMQGPTYVSFIWPALLSRVRAPWPEDYWPDLTAGLQIRTRDRGASIYGSAQWGDKGAIRVTFSEQSSGSLVELLKKCNLASDSEADLSDISYKLFEDYLEENGVRYIKTLQRGTLGTLLEDNVPSEIGALMNCNEVDCFEGMEDLKVNSIEQLEDGNLGIEALFNLRRVELTVSITKADDNYLLHKIEETGYFYDPQIDDGEVTYKTCIRPYFRVTFTIDSKQRSCKHFRALALSLPEEKRRRKQSSESISNC